MADPMNTRNTGVRVERSARHTGEYCMAVASDVPKESFRLSMLIYDTRYRSITIQIFVLLLFALFVSWLISNTISNLAIRGKEFNFGFLWSRMPRALRLRGPPMMAAPAGPPDRACITENPLHTPFPRV